MNTLSDGHNNQAYRLLLPRLEAGRAAYIQDHGEDWDTFIQRLRANFPRLFSLLIHLYGQRWDFFYYLEELLLKMADAWMARPRALKDLDAEREDDLLWYQTNQMVAGVCYVDLYAGTLNGIRKRVPYFKELGLTFLHLMPLFRTPPGEDDGGYAISSYREVDPSLGTMEELSVLAAELRQEGISLVLDFIFNHTSDDHEWAQAAKVGDLDFQDYYYIFPDRRMPDAYEAHLREIFPHQHPGAFTYSPEMEKWVWTTFNSYQWDLNYANPAVFNSMVAEMLFLANVGVEVLRLDAVAFIWKQMGSDCENLPEAHLIIQAFNAIARVAAPALLFKSEAIVHPDEVIKYIDLHECQLSYNPLLMAFLWNSLATQEVRLLNQALRERYEIPGGCAWVNYVRCHDDIGWTFSDEDAARLGINAYDHRQFLNAFYTGRFAGSFARGLPFQENPKTGDARISGTSASLAGLEKASLSQEDDEVELAIRRIILLYGVVLTLGGIPLIYLGDEIGALNDYSYLQDQSKAQDSRWVHRPFSDDEKLALRHNPNAVEGKIYAGLSRLIEMRKTNPIFAGQKMTVIETNNEHLLGYLRIRDGERVLVLANFSENDQMIPKNALRLHAISYAFTDLLTGKCVPYEDLVLKAYEIIILTNRSDTHPLTTDN